jgi:L-aspartate oxidase
MSTEISALNNRPVIIGGGAAGLMTALQLAPEPVLLLSKAPLGAEASSLWAQGGLAAAMGGMTTLPCIWPIRWPQAQACATSRRSPDRSRGACGRRASRQAWRRLRPAADGGWRLGLEAAHGRNRIVHATGDGTGREIMRALIAAVRRCPSITLLEGVEARSLIVEDNAIKGVLAVNAQGPLVIDTGRVVIATGGIGGLFSDSTNPAGCFGQGLALAARAGAKLSDLEFVQFHPTAFDGPSRPMPLVTEAVRGDGAILIDDTGQRFMADQPGAELAPATSSRARSGAAARRDIASSSMRGNIRARNLQNAIPSFPPSAKWPGSIPRPIRFREAGGALPHGRDSGGYRRPQHRGRPVGLRRSQPHRAAWRQPARQQFADGSDRLCAMGRGERPGREPRPAENARGQCASTRIRSFGRAADPVARPRRARDRHGIERAIRGLYPLADGHSAAADPALVGLMIAVAAWRREESRGGHFRSDFPDALPSACRLPSRLRTHSTSPATSLKPDLCLSGVPSRDAYPLLPLMYEPLVRTALLEDSDAPATSRRMRSCRPTGKPRWCCARASPASSPGSTSRAVRFSSSIPPSGSPPSGPDGSVVRREM